jgi:hypothetical protein
MVCTVRSVFSMSCVFFVNGVTAVNSFLFKIFRLRMQLVLGVIHMFVLSGVIFMGGMSTAIHMLLMASFFSGCWSIVHSVLGMIGMSVPVMVLMINLSIIFFHLYFLSSAHTPPPGSDSLLLNTITAFR